MGASLGDYNKKKIICQFQDPSLCVTKVDPDSSPLTKIIYEFNETFLRETYFLIPGLLIPET